MPVYQPGAAELTINSNRRTISLACSAEAGLLSIQSKGVDFV
jgi:hypothetical protein